MSRKRREPKGKKINPTLFVFCEGDTEEAYVNFLKSLYRLPSIQIRSKIGGNNITSEFIAKFKKGKPTHEKDLDFLMYDSDVPEIIERLKKVRNSILLLSNPCIELWFLLHYKNQTASISSEKCCREMSNRNRVYNKGVIDKKLNDKLISKRDVAVKRAKGLTANHNPSSSVYKLIEILDQLKQT